MKKYKLFFIIILSIIAQLGYTQSWQWAKGNGSGNFLDNGGKVITDPSGNFYVIISGKPDTCFFQTTYFIVNGIDDMFIAKYDANGNEVWVRQLGGPNTNTINTVSEGLSDIIYDPVGNCLYVAGAFYETCDFGVITLTAASNDEDNFYAKYDLNGNCIWAKKAGCPWEDDGMKLATDGSGQLYITGFFYQFGNLDTLLVNRGDFLAKCDSSGSGLWTKHIARASNLTQPVWRVTAMNYYSNNLYLIGQCTDSISIDTIHFSNTSNNYQVLSKWDLNGNIQWGKELGSPEQIIIGLH